jgi:hypothetical protein
LWYPNLLWLVYICKLYRCSCRWGEITSLNCCLQRAYFSYARWHTIMKSHGGMILTGETKELGEKPVVVPPCPPQIPHGLTPLRGDRVATKFLSHDTAKLWSYISHYCLLFAWITYRS